MNEFYQVSSEQICHQLTLQSYVGALAKMKNLIAELKKNMQNHINDEKDNHELRDEIHNDNLQTKNSQPQT